MKRRFCRRRHAEGSDFVFFLGTGRNVAPECTL
jgi:hypothetical protein